MAYFVLTPKGEESLNKVLSPDVDHPRRGPSYGCNTSCVKQIKSLSPDVDHPRRGPSYGCNTSCVKQIKS